ncbi:MAG: hypothetical protein QNJ97_16050, partial [Myxococcota bacterium]|nr:hypothetical protein [Myxococcota bacterium]
NRILPLKTIAWTIENPPAPFFKGDSFLAILRYKNTQKSLTECHCPFLKGGRSKVPFEKGDIGDFVSMGNASEQPESHAVFSMLVGQV